MTEWDPRASSPVRVDFGTFDLADSDTHTDMGFHPANGLIFSTPGRAVICTGIHTGLVNVSVTTRRHPPTEADADAWDEIMDHSVDSLTGTLHVASVMADAPPLPPLTPHGPGPYRIRVHARGRDLAPDGTAEEPSEDYLLVTWPAPPSPDIIHKQTDQRGSQLRTGPHRTPPASPPISGEEADRKRMLRERLGKSMGRHV
ncbi:hypothetical protein [Streptomyces hygroscopicus]|uniref:hypothetical protein n=1 Tax=Streptomyces hygroscopicus TaxID=1912 RepID=UPI001BDE85E6|nr:hypothetical protein [Streptomyces hygroscopicus]